MNASAFRNCPDCGAENPLDAEHCSECNHVLDPIARVLSAGRRPRRSHPTIDMPGVGKVVEEEGKVITRRRHTRVGFLGIGASDKPAPEGSAPNWIWFAIGAICIAVVFAAAVHITTQPPPFEVPGASPIQANQADSLHKVLQTDSLNVGNNLRLANLLYDTQNFEKAVPYYRRVLRLDATLIDARVDYAVSLHQSGNTPEAFAQLDRVLEMQPNHAVALFDKGVIHEFIGEFDEAIATYERTLALPLEPDLKHVVEQRLRATEERMRAASSGETSP
jgi:cytochrome c-type biogenesis protein CcmH/NrfG